MSALTVTPALAAPAPARPPLPTQTPQPRRLALVPTQRPALTLVPALISPNEGDWLYVGNDPRPHVASIQPNGAVNVRLVDTFSGAGFHRVAVESLSYDPPVNGVIPPAPIDRGGWVSDRYAPTLGQHARARLARPASPDAA